MEVKRLGANIYKIEGLTLGKLLSIQYALQDRKEAGKSTVCQNEVLDVLNPAINKFLS